MNAVEVQHEGALAGTIRPEQRNLLAARNCKIDPAQCLSAVGVAEVEMGDQDRTVSVRQEWRCMWMVVCMRVGDRCARVAVHVFVLVTHHFTLQPRHDLTECAEREEESDSAEQLHAKMAIGSGEGFR